MRVRRTLLILTGLALVAAGCGGDDSKADPATTTAPPGSPGATAGAPVTSAGKVDPKLCPVKALDNIKSPVEIKFWHSFNAANETAIKALADKYNAGQAKVKVTLLNQVTYDETFQKYVAALRANSELPHIVVLEETAMQAMLDSKSIVPIGACLAADNYDVADFAAPLIGQYSQGGVLQTMPFQLSNPVLYYNKKAFAAAGLDPNKPPATFAEVVEYSRKLVASGATKKGIAIEVQSWYPEQFMSKAGDAIVNNDNGRVNRATEAKLDSKSFADTLDWLATMTKEGLVLNVGRNPAARDHLLAVAQLGAAMTIGTSAALGTVYQLLPNFPGVEVGVAPLPGPTGGGVTVGGGSLYMVAKNTSDEQKAAMWDFMKFLNTPESQIAWHVGTGYIPTRLSAAKNPDVLKNWDARPGFKVAYDQLAGSKSPVGGGGPLIGDYIGFRAAVETAVESVLNGAAPGPAQAKAQTDATSAIKEYNRRVGA